MHISAQSYPSIAGELVPITPENALKIRQAVLALQKDNQRTRAGLAKAQATHPAITSLTNRLDACFQEMSAMLDRRLDAGELAALRGLGRYSLSELKRLLRTLDRLSS